MKFPLFLLLGTTLLAQAPSPPTGLKASVITPATAIIPASATVASNLQTAYWKEQFDPGTKVDSGTSATGTMTVVSSPSLSGSAREFYTTYTDSGGELYWQTFGSNPNPTHFFTDEWIYIASPSTSLANVESDLNEVDPQGNTVIFGFQCDGYAGVWDYTYTDTSSHWTRSSQPCNPRKWAVNSWHHIQIYFSRDTSDNVTYHSVWFDNIEQPINATVRSKLALGWATVDSMNFQIDGLGTSGSVTAYMDNVKVYMW